MKKIVIAVIVVALLVAIGTIGAFAAGPSHVARAVSAAGYYDDSNGDTNYGGSGFCGKYYADADGDGVCDNYGACGNGQYYVDADGDGVCDNYGACVNYGGCGDHSSWGHCRGQGHRNNW